MNKYKLLKDYPPYKAGDIVSSDGNSGYINLKFKEESKVRVIIPEQVVENETDWFEIVNEIPKIVTEEGTELYGNNKCWFVTPHRSQWSESMHRNFAGYSGDLRCKYFSSESNAKQYFVELQAKKRGIEIGTEVFDINTKKYSGKVKYILFTNNSIQLNIDNKGYTDIASLLTLKELAEEEGLEIGMILNKYLTLAWLRTYNEYYNTAYKVENFTVIANKPYFILENDAPLKITGFKKFKEQWEIKQKGSDLDIDNTCTTCKFNIHDDPQICEPCSYLDNRFRESNYK